MESKRSQAPEGHRANVSRAQAVSSHDFPACVAELFDAQPEAYRAEILGSAPRIAVEAAGKFGWTRYVASEDDVVGMTGFGASAPIERLYSEFGITADAIAARAKKLTGR